MNEMHFQLPVSEHLSELHCDACLAWLDGTHRRIIEFKRISTMWTQHLADINSINDPLTPHDGAVEAIDDVGDDHDADDDNSEAVQADETELEPPALQPHTSEDTGDQITTTTAIKVEFLSQLKNDDDEADGDLTGYDINDDHNEDEQHLIFKLSPDEDDDKDNGNDDEDDNDDDSGGVASAADPTEPIFGSCDLCGARLRHRSGLVQHFRTVHDHQPDNDELAQQPFACDHCPQRHYTSQRHLQRHMELHHPNGDNASQLPASSRRCRYCRSEFADGTANAKTTKRLRQLHYTRCAVLAERRQRPRPFEREPLRCLECLATYLRPQTLQRHYRTFHAGADWAAVERRICVTCFRQFADEALAAQHVQDVHERWRCPLCQKLCACAESLERHMHAHSGKQRRYRCDVCDGTYVTANQLKIHHRRKHTDERPFACEEPDCDKRYAERSELNVHRRAAHSSERHACEWCTSEFATAKYLGQHVAKEHTGDYRFYVCKVCEGGERKFVNTRLLNAHMAVHHPDAEVEEAVWWA